MGWTEQQALKSDVISIQLAMEGKVELIKACYFHEVKKPKPTLVQRWKGFVRDHNLVRSRKA